MPVSEDDHALAARAVTDAGRLLVHLRECGGDGDGRSLGARGDAAAHAALVELLGAARPADPVLSEEGHDDEARLESERVWIIDPLDGTREFGEPGRVDWAVHVALVVDGTPVAGAVALPAMDVTFSTASPPPPPPARAGRLRVVVSRTRPPPVATGVASALDADLVPLGSAGAKAMAVVRGEVDAYVHAGGQYEWDSAAPVAVATAAGLHASRLDGSPLRYNAPEPWLPDLVVCRPDLAPAIIAAAAT
ncbi:MAG TPA: 3'(2'),5'-bisphosphate nucleotidase CysQ [Acidimicrobiales bacterium]|nr:3'(2'),5'-bisphosphate nucleotidase CysQ [Acidimicrobiales bacterium]